MSARILLEGMPNTRDLGGMLTSDGQTILPGRLIRSGNLYPATETDLKWLSENVGYVIDLRSEEECREEPDPSVSGTEYLHLPVIRSLTAGVSRDEASEEEAFSILDAEPEQAKRHMMRAYLGFVADPYSVSQYSRFVQILSDPGEKAVLWHCSAGKDRSGFATAIILEILGVPREEIIRDYLKTNEYLKPGKRQMLEAVKSRLGEISEKLDGTLSWMFDAHEEYLLAVYEKAEELYGSFPGFLEKGLGVDGKAAARLRAMYLK